MTTSKQIPESVAVLLRHDGWLRRIARQLIDDVHLRDDAIQETWLTAWQKAPVAGAGQLSWLATVLRRSKQRLQRSAGRRSHHEEAAASSESIEAGALAEKEETRRQIAEAVLQLEEPYRAALVQRYYHDLSAGEIGRQLGLPVATVRTHLHRGLARLRRQLQSRYGNQWIAVVTPLAAGPGPGATAGLDKGSALLPSLPAAAPALLLVVAGAVTWWMLPSQSNAPAPVQSIAASRLPVERLSKQALGAPATLAPLPAQAHRSEQPLEPVAATADPGKPQPARILLNGQLIGLWPGVPWTETLVVRRLDESDGRILLSTPVTAAGHFEVDLSPFFLETGPSHVFLHGLDPAYAAFSKPVNLWIEGKPPQAPARIEVQVEVQPVGILSGEVRDPFGHRHHR
jgi:RNA polymerase sigma-70 factor (ECF subfamily)